MGNLLIVVTSVLSSGVKAARFPSFDFGSAEVIPTSDDDWAWKLNRLIFEPSGYRAAGNAKFASQVRLRDQRTKIGWECALHDDCLVSE